MAAKKRATVEQRLQALERDAHKPFDFGWLIDKLDRLEREVENLKRFGSRRKGGRKGS